MTIKNPELKNCKLVSPALLMPNAGETNFIIDFCREKIFSTGRIFSAVQLRGFRLPDPARILSANSPPTTLIPFEFGLISFR
jgi:hypothetical protein